jgi:hypothetical protein
MRKEERGKNPLAAMPRAPAQERCRVFGVRKISFLGVVVVLWFVLLVLCALGALLCVLGAVPVAALCFGAAWFVLFSALGGPAPSSGAFVLRGARCSRCGGRRFVRGVSPSGCRVVRCASRRCRRRGGS